MKYELPVFRQRHRLNWRKYELEAGAGCNRTLRDFELTSAPSAFKYFQLLLLRQIVICLCKIFIPRSVFPPRDSALNSASSALKTMRLRKIIRNLSIR